MKLSEIEDADKLATKLDLRELRLELLEKLSSLEQRMNRLERVIWVPVITGIAQILVTIFHR